MICVYLCNLCRYLYTLYIMVWTWSTSEVKSLQLSQSTSGGSRKSREMIRFLRETHGKSHLHRTRQPRRSPAHASWHQPGDPDGRRIGVVDNGLGYPYPPRIKHGNWEWTIYRRFSSWNLHSVRGIFQPCLMKPDGYPLVLSHGYGKIHHFPWENSLWPLSIANCSIEGNLEFSIVNEG